ncbi:MAG: thioredoxin-disulfide reductase [Patescibacteria group bacterium]|jgi:thioredoxin reductase (NADPH)
MEKLVIIGSGPAGLTAAIYAARANLAPLVLEGKQPGGQLTTTTLVENWPGSVDGIMGPDLVQNMRLQAQKFGAKLVFEQIISVNFSQKPLIVTTEKAKYEAEAVIIATGARSRMLGLPREEEFLGKGVHTCATCDGAFYRNKQIMVIGGGDSAMEEANFLTKFAQKVYIVHRSDSFKASVFMLERAKKNPKIEFLLNSEVIEYSGVSKLENVKIVNSKTQKSAVMAIDGVFMAIGHIPNTEPFVGQLELVKLGYIQPKNNVLTEIEGVFVAGDVSDWRYRQAITAAGLGCMAALEAEKYLAGKE